MSDWPGPECGVFCLLIVDIIPRSVLVLFSLLRAINYHCNKGPVIVYNIKILTIYGGLFCIIFIQSIQLGQVINIGFISISNIFWKIDIMYHCILNYNDIFIFVIFQIKISSIIFSQILILWYLEYSLSQFFEAVK